MRLKKITTGTYEATKKLRDLRIIKNRLTSHLLQIEAKLDITALKTAKMGE